MLTTKQLRYFDALARLGHFGRAADHCCVTQPALSMQISQMEEQLGVTLLERRSSGVILTAAGAEVARRASNILRELRDLSELALSYRTPFSTPLRLGVISTVAPYLLPLLLPKLRDEHPQLALQLREAQTSLLIAELLAASLDLLVVALPLDHPEIKTLELRSDRFLLAVPAASDMFTGELASAEELRNERLLLLDEGHCFRDQALTVCRVRGQDGSGIFGASSLSTLVQMVASGHGVTLLPEISARQEAKNVGIRLVPFAAPEPARTLGLAWRATCPRETEFRLLGKLIQDVWDRT